MFVKSKNTCLWGGSLNVLILCEIGAFVKFYPTNLSLLVINLKYLLNLFFVLFFFYTLQSVCFPLKVSVWHLFRNISQKQTEVAFSKQFSITAWSFLIGCLKHLSLIHTLRLTISCLCLPNKIKKIEQLLKKKSGAMKRCLHFTLHFLDFVQSNVIMLKKCMKLNFGTYPDDPYVFVFAVSPLCAATAKNTECNKRAQEFQFQLIFISFLEKVLYTSLYQQSDRQWMDKI